MPDLGVLTQEELCLIVRSLARATGLPLIVDGDTGYGEALNAMRLVRELEARFQWEQALTLKPEEDDAEKIRAKVAKGLPVKVPARVVKKSKEPVKAEGPKRQTKLGTQRTPE